ncbi:MAG TPA: serine hydrolase domain-containing protein [Pedobacter sp.]|nr:serine hydrolase domain-containing protein [Pedobacter sp.]
MDENGSSLEGVLKNGLPQYQLPNTTDQMLEKFCSMELAREPGKEFDYKNADFIILGKIVEKLSGKSFEEVLKEKILLPLAMHNSGMLAQDRIVSGLANTYFYRDDIKKLVNDLPVYMENWYASGAMYATSDDILKFSNGMLFHILEDGSTIIILSNTGTVNMDDFAAKLAEKIME